jgi:hypothetical protein
LIPFHVHGELDVGVPGVNPPPPSHAINIEQSLQKWKTFSILGGGFLKSEATHQAQTKESYVPE